ncbi:MAG: hypothetical protein FH756_14400 [Firmicutes bacterium]|nr:hypothetical protein [Bacillota bacterium]
MICDNSKEEKDKSSETRQIQVKRCQEEVSAEPGHCGIISVAAGAFQTIFTDPGGGALPIIRIFTLRNNSLVNLLVWTEQTSIPPTGAPTFVIGPGQTSSLTVTFGIIVSAETGIVIGDYTFSWCCLNPTVVTQDNDQDVTAQASATAIAVAEAIAQVFKNIFPDGEIIAHKKQEHISQKS